MLIPWELLCNGSDEGEGLSRELIEVAAADPLIFDEIMRGILHVEPCIQIQAAGMLEKITQVRPLFLTPYKRVLVEKVARIDLVKVRQQVAVLYGRGVWDEWDMKQVVTLLTTWMEKEEDEHIIINALQSLYTLSKQKEWIQPIFLTQHNIAKHHAKVVVRQFAENLQV